ncbi:hypothetical protein BASA81_003140 [Batrachochytrium salamandrivorans]|nr:hypothetical protein BASA81_003140 [Batrachochytrium salamandrivorans]
MAEAFSLVEGVVANATNLSGPVGLVFVRLSLSGMLGGICFLVFALSWRQVAWLREPGWIKAAPTVPAPNFKSWFTGTVMEFVQRGRICRTFMHADQPDILRLGNGIAGGLFRDFIMVKDPKIAREIMEEPSTCKPERGYRAFRRLTGYKGSPDFLSSHSHKDPLYARTRVLAYEILMKRVVDRYDDQFIDCVNEFVNRVGKEGTFHVVDEMHLIATSLVTRIAFNETSDKFDKDLFQSAVWIINDMIARPPNCSMTWLDNLPLPRNFELWRRQDILVTTIEQMIDNKRKNPGGDDIISQLLLDKRNSTEDLLGVLSIFFFAGFDTTSNTMSMILYHLAHNPDIQELARRDVFEVLGEKESPKMNKIFHMKYLMAVIKETLRMYPTVPMVTREVTETHEDGVCPRFKEESTFGVVINFFGLHYNPKAWNKPNEFCPERWLDPSFDADRDMEQRLYCPFAIGKRACLGRQFAYIEMLTVIGTILQRYRIVPSTEKGATEVKIHEGGTLVVDHNLKLVLEPYVAGQVPDLLLRTQHPENEKVYSLAEVSRHHTRDDLWMILDGGVYDVTKFANGKDGHPGGVEVLVAYGGADATSEFDFVSHSKFARKMMKRFRIGKVRDAENQLLTKEDGQKHILGEDLVRGKKRTTVPMAEGSLSDPSPLRGMNTQ